ncbi:unnamed protein product [Arabidopsis lyrata]|nr:unnamed protein product [Arabidopsis lyrata]
MFEQNVSTFVFLDEIDPAAQRYKIKVQIVKLWRGFQKETGSAIEMVLIDEKGTRMHATVEDKLMNKFKSDLKEDQSILVDTFQLVNNGFEYKTSPHSFKISFFRTTSVTICDDFPNDVPEKYFVDFLKILAGVLDSKTLVDVIGHIVNIGPLEDIMIRGRSTTKLDVELRDTNDARLLCTFWGKYADQVSTYAAEHSADMIVCVVRFAQIKEFRGNRSISNSYNSTRILLDPQTKVAHEFRSNAAAVIYLGGYEIKRKAEYLKSATRVKDLRGLSELLENKTKPLVVAISGRVGSSRPLKCEHSGIWGVFMEEKAKLVFGTRSLHGGLMRHSAEFLLKHKEVPWFLEDSTGRINVVGARFAEGFYDNLKEFVFVEPASELIKKFVKPEGFVKILEHNCFERVHELGKPLTIVGEAVKYSNGALVIKRPTDGSFMFFDGYSSVDKMISLLESQSQALVYFSIALTAVGTLVYASYVMPLIKKSWFLDKSDTTAGQRAETETKHNSMGKAQSNYAFGLCFTCMILILLLDTK